jgi:hypothetical protein
MRRANRRNPAVILPVEDSPADQELVRRPVEKGIIRKELRIVQVGIINSWITSPLQIGEVPESDH